MKAKEKLSFLILLCGFILHTSHSDLLAKSTGDDVAVNVTGTVTSFVDGEPLPGVTVLVKGTSIGTITNVDGNYSISVPDENDILVFSFIGYVTEEIPLNGRTKVDIALTEHIQSLKEVVVVGYGNRQRADVTGAVATVSSQDIKNIPVASLDQALAGQAAGVHVQQTTGAPGGGIKIRVRGSGSIGAGDDPLYVIDGFPISDNYNHSQNPIASINPNDIESISVLKDASATSIYGSRGANGVILITTKQAKAGSNKIDFNVYSGWQSIPQKGRPDMMNAREFAEWKIEEIQDLARINGDPPPTLEDIPEDYRNPESLGEGTDWYDEALRVAQIQSYNLTLTKGSENLRSVVSAGYFNQEGVVLNTAFERFSLRANIEGDLNEKFTLGFNLAPSYTIGNLASTEGHFNEGVLTQATLMSPLPPVRQPDGSFTPSIGSAGTADNLNPINYLENYEHTIGTVRTLANLFVNYEIIPGLALRSSINIDWRNRQIDNFLPSYVGRFRNPPPQDATGVSNSNTILNWLNENTLTYDKTFNEDHRVSFLLGYTAQKEVVKTKNLSGTGFPNDDISTLNAATIINGSTGIAEWSLLSYLARVNYAYKDKYLLTATVRRDGSSRFGAKNRWGTFPSASIGWRVSEENFMDNISLISELKLRGSYGYSGNNSIGNYTHIPGVTADDYVFGGLLANGVQLNSLANEVLGWELSEQMDLGVDLGLFSGRVYLIADYYVRHTKDMLLSIPVLQSSGFSNAISNVGEIRNHGFEFSLNTENLVNEFKWNTNFNITFNRNKVLALRDDGEPLTSSTHITAVGEPMGQFYGYIVDGIFQTPDEVAAGPTQAALSMPGTYKLRDFTGDNIITVDDKTAIGDPQPDFIFGLTNRFSYKNFDLSIFINGAQGGKILKYNQRFLWNGSGLFNVPVELKDRWRSPENPGNGIIPTTQGHNGARTQVTSRMVEDASYLYVRNVNLGYNFPAKLLNGTGFIKNARVYVSGQNLLLFTEYSGGNPEINTNGSNSLAPGVDYTGYPIPRTVTIGANITF